MWKKKRKFMRQCEIKDKKFSQAMTKIKALG